jgi:FtsH-binding integral membrane protein
MSSFEKYAGGLAFYAQLEKRMDFLRKTYTHLLLAILAFVLCSIFFYKVGVGAAVLDFIAGNRYGWLMFLGGFMLVGWLATAMSTLESRPAAYAGLLLYTVGEALIFSPLITLAATVYTGVLPQATIVTLLTFAALTGYVFITKQDFSFLRTALTVGAFVALGLIVAGALFGFQLGLWFSAAMVLFACGAILYSTSKVLHSYRTDQYVAAALSLFASVALLFWYVLSLFMGRR